MASLRLRKGQILCPMASDPFAPCPMLQCQSKAFSDQELATVLPADGYEAYQHGRFKVVEADTFESLVTRYAGKLKDTNEVLVDAIRLKLPDARQCGNSSCNYGPIDRAFCEDVGMHDGMVVAHRPNGEEIRVNNRCPKCDWTSRHWHDWPRWDGKLTESFLRENPGNLVPVFRKPKPHKMEQTGDCKVCTRCRECSGYGTACFRAAAVARRPGERCGCDGGVGVGVCCRCGMCQSCCDTAPDVNCRPENVVDAGSSPSDSDDSDGDSDSDSDSNSDDDSISSHGDRHQALRRNTASLRLPEPQHRQLFVHHTTDTEQRAAGAALGNRTAISANHQRIVPLVAPGRFFMPPLPSPPPPRERRPLQIVPGQRTQQQQQQQQRHLAPSNAAPRLVTCTHWLRGNCTRGERCWYSHTQENVWGSDILNSMQSEICSQPIRVERVGGSNVVVAGGAPGALLLHQPGALSMCGGNPLGRAQSNGYGNCSGFCFDCGAGTHWSCCGSAESESRYCLPGTTAEQAQRNTRLYTPGGTRTDLQMSVRTCGAHCSANHYGRNCLRCGAGFGTHNGHRCADGQTGSFF